MTIDEAIIHAEEVAELNEECTRIYAEHGRTMESFSCKECASEHRQLAEWLKELRELRRNRIGRVSVGCATCIHMKTDDYTKRPCDRCCNNYFSKYEAEVKADEDSN